MHLKAAFRQPQLKRGFNGLRFFERSAMYQPVVCVSTPWPFGIFPLHPGIKRIVQE